ncbi:hypothetical protein [Castellaniella sp.]|uniref:hypothetical protein n=1 Tax=Castellaniella sp. TaxID=1955812 RepID=UPI003C72BED7
MTDYSKFDAMLLDAIKSGATVTVSEMIGNHKMLRVTATQLVGDRPLPRDAYSSAGLVGRVFDRRLQALRRAGRIRYCRGVWEAIEQ